MEDAADAQDAIRNTDGIDLLGRTIRVEVSTGEFVILLNSIIEFLFLEINYGNELRM